MRNFEDWIKTLRCCIYDYKYYTDFEKVIKNVDAIKIELNILNVLIGSPNIEQKFIDVITKYPETLKCIPILLAVRSLEIHIAEAEKDKIFSFNEKNHSIEEYVIFMQNTGLFDMLQNHMISNLVDYVMGVETGLDSNARKNRSGDIMENLVEKYIQEAGFVKDKNYFKEITTIQLENKFGLNLSKMSNQGKTIKKFDFAIKTDDKVYGVEVNFYASSGSKLNETARSYKSLTLASKDISGFQFVWITDGLGWIAAKNNLRETFEQLEYLFNLSELSAGILKTL